MVKLVNVLCVSLSNVLISPETDDLLNTKEWKYFV